MIASDGKHFWFHAMTIGALYIGAFEPVVRGIVRAISPTFELVSAVALQAVIYMPPLLFAWYGLHDRRFVLLLATVAFLILFYPFRVHGDLLSYFLGFKLYFALFFYLPVIKYLSKLEDFEIRFLKHVSYILSTYVTWEIAELIGSLYVPSLALWLKQFAVAEEQQLILGRVLGMAFDYQTGALAVSLSALMLLLRQRYVSCAVLLGVSFMVGLRTWFFATIITSAIVILTRRGVGRIFWILFLIVLAVAGYLLLQGTFESYMSAFSEGRSGALILALLLRDGWFLFTQGGLIPNGFVQMGYSPIFGEQGNDVPEQFMVNEVGILRMHYEMGGIVTLSWLALLYYPFLSRGLVFYKNHYMIISFLTMFGFLHHLTMMRPFVFMFLIFCSVQATRTWQLPRKL